MEEIAKELARILIPLPIKTHEGDDKDYSTLREAKQKERRNLVGDLMGAASASPLEDPILAKLTELATEKEALQRKISLIVAYAREFIRPEPYRLKALAQAANMSISGIRTVYKEEDVAFIADEILRRNNKGTVSPRRQGVRDPNEQKEPVNSGKEWWTIGKTLAVEDEEESII